MGGPPVWRVPAPGPSLLLPPKPFVKPAHLTLHGLTPQLTSHGHEPQCKAAKLPAPVPEFASTCIIRNLPVHQPLPCQLKERLPTAWPVPHEASCALQVIPQESQLLRDSQSVDKKGGHRVREVVFGIPWTPDQFTAEAVKQVIQLP